MRRIRKSKGGKHVALATVACLVSVTVLGGCGGGGGGGGTPGETKTNPTDGAELIWIPAGTFTMRDDSGHLEEKPAHQQTVSGFWLYRKEVTNAQYGQFMQATGHEAPYYWNDSTLNGAQQPAVGVNWFDAKAYAEWAGSRLPTEAE